jgi:tRNA (mo5U34)-methyltransferase
VVLFLGVIYHVKSPLLALERVASVTKSMMILEAEVLRGKEDLPVFYFYPGYVGDGTNFWIPSPAGLEAMVRAVGFRKIEVKHCTIGEQDPRGRLVLHAWK